MDYDNEPYHLPKQVTEWMKIADEYKTERDAALERVRELEALAALRAERDALREALAELVRLGNRMWLWPYVTPENVAKIRGEWKSYALGVKIRHLLTPREPARCGQCNGSGEWGGGNGDCPECDGTGFPGEPDTTAGPPTETPEHARERRTRWAMEYVAANMDAEDEEDAAMWASAFVRAMEAEAAHQEGDIDQ